MWQEAIRTCASDGMRHALSFVTSRSTIKPAINRGVQSECITSNLFAIRRRYRTGSDPSDAWPHPTLRLSAANDCGQA